MKSKIGVVAVLIALGVGWAVGLGCYPFVRWSPLNCRHEDIDINTGRIRHQRFLVGMCVRERFEETPISPQFDLSNVAPDWRRVNTFSPLVRHSPHYRFHSAIHQARELELIWQGTSFTPEAKKQACQDMLQLWQTSQSDYAAEGYIRALSDLATDRDSDAPPLTIEELPDA